jgi:hypothetical protein
MDTLRFSFQFVMITCLTLLCSCATQEPFPPELPPETSINKGAGRGDELLAKIRWENGEELLFLVDTGASATMLDSSLEPRLGKCLGTKTFYWIGEKKQVARVYKFPELYSGKTALLATGTVLTTDLSEKSPGRHISGILGIDFLRHYCIQMDFEAGTMRFLDPDHLGNKDLGKAFPISFDSSTGHAFVNENFLAAKHGQSVIDTGCNFDGVLTPKLFQQWTNNLQSASTAPTGAVFPNGLLGGESYTNLYLRGDGGNNLIGLSFLARNLVTLNFPKRTMYLRQKSVGSLAEGSGFFDEFYPKELRKP